MLWIYEYILAFKNKEYSFKCAVFNEFSFEFSFATVASGLLIWGL